MRSVSYCSRNSSLSPVGVEWGLMPYRLLWVLQRECLVESSRRINSCATNRIDQTSNLCMYIVWTSSFVILFSLLRETFLLLFLFLMINSEGLRESENASSSHCFFFLIKIFFPDENGILCTILL